MAPLTSKEKTARYRQRINADPVARAGYLARKKRKVKYEGAPKNNKLVIKK